MDNMHTKIDLFYTLSTSSATLLGHKDWSQGYYFQSYSGYAMWASRHCHVLGWSGCLDVKKTKEGRDGEKDFILRFYFG